MFFSWKVDMDAGRVGRGNVRRRWLFLFVCIVGDRLPREEAVELMVFILD